MIQPDLMYYMNDGVIPELNIQTKKIIKENVTEENDDQISALNGIVEIKYGNEIYRTWKVEFIRPYIFKFLRVKFPDSLIVRELNDIDITVFDYAKNNQIPIEIQKATINNSKGDGKGFSHSHFEDSIRRQLEDNVHNYGRCWFFFDYEYLRYLQSGSLENTTTNINMTWLIKLMRENTLKVFVIKYDGIVKELTTKDFDFLKDISQTCPIKEDSDERVLNRNKLKICHNVLIRYNFTQEEITQFENEFDNRNKSSVKEYSSRFFTKSNNERCKLYGLISDAFKSLFGINDCLNMNNVNRANKYYAISLGIFDNVGTYGHGNLLKFTDKFDICKYFPGYLRNKEQWESYRDTNLNHNTFMQISSGNLKFNKTMFDY